MNEPEHREYLRATCSCAWETPRVRIPCRCRDLNANVEREERTNRTSYFGNVRNNRSCPSQQQRACNARHSCGTSIAFDRIHNRTCTCDSLSCKPTDKEAIGKAETDGFIPVYHETFVLGIFALGNARAFGVAVLVENA